MSHITLATSASNAKPITIPKLVAKKTKGEKIVSITAYDFTFAKLIDELKVVDVILVGDSAASVIQGHSTTLPINLDQIIYHTSCVARACSYSLVVADMPFLSYEVSSTEAVFNAGRLVKDGGACAVKVEGGREVATTVKKIISANIPVLGHIGLTPQSIHKMGGYVVQGRAKAKYGSKDKEELLFDAQALEDAGVFAIVIEGVPAETASFITDKVSIPTIGIGAGSGCDGQILVLYDMLGLSNGKKPKFVKEYISLRSLVKDAIEDYATEVRKGLFPLPEHSYTDLQKGEKAENGQHDKSSAL